MIKGRLLTTIDWHKITQDNIRKGLLLGCANLMAFERPRMAKKYVACDLHRSDDWLAILYIEQELTLLFSVHVC